MTLWLKLLLAAIGLATALFTWYTGPARRARKAAIEKERKKRELEKAVAEGDADTVARLMAELADSL